MIKLITTIVITAVTTATYAQETPPPVQEAKPVVQPPVPPPPPSKETVEAGEMELIEFPDVEAEFPGGANGMQKYIAENVVYPELSLEMGEQGTVYSTFVVERDGSISNVKITRGVSQQLDREAKRVIAAMPKWKPGEANGKTVRTKCMLPIKFRLETNTKKKKR
jgi:protein TonB